MVAQVERPNRVKSRTLDFAIEGLVQVFTSNQRTFFTGVMSQALRIAGQGTPVLVVQFLKGGIGQGYDRPINLGQQLDWVRCDLPRCVDSGEVTEEERRAILDLWQYTQNVIYQSRYDLVVLDELSLAMNYGLIPESEVLGFLNQRPRQVDIIMTGPQMPASILAVADQITEMRRSHQP